jgi:hypothetical protein
MLTTGWQGFRIPATNSRDLIYGMGKFAVGWFREGATHMRFDLRRLALSVFVLAMANVAVFADPITLVPYASVTGTSMVTFEEIAGAGSGTNFDNVLVSGGLSFAERFAGQTRTSSGDFDVLSGSPTNPLTLQTGAANQNVDVVIVTGTNVVTGLGPNGFPNGAAIGEGSLAVLFPIDQSSFGFEVVAAAGGTATVDLFRRNGTLIQQLTLSALANQGYGFSRDAGIQDIAGFSIFNNDATGIGLDDIKYQTAVPEPSSVALVLIGLAGVFAFRSLENKKFKRGGASSSS